MKHLFFFFLCNVFLMVFGLTNSAWAYLDPGAGSMVLQILLGGIAGVVVILKLYWRRFVCLFRREAKEESGSLIPKNRKS
jgi:hypothetical protein